MRDVGVVLAGVLVLSLLPSWVQAEEATEQALVIRRPESTETLQDLLVAVKEQGGRPRHIFPPDAAIVELPPGGLAGWEESFAIERAPLGSVLPSGSPIARIAAGVWNSRFQRPELLPDDIPGVQESFGDRRPDALVMPIDRKQAWRIVKAAPYGGGFYDTSEFMIGSIALGVFLMESNGSAYNWSDSEVTQTMNGIYAAMDWWISRGGAAANLSFTYDLHIRHPTSYEPIQMNHSDEGLWISEAMAALGYTSGTAATRTRQYINALRDARGTNWSYAIFVVDSSASVNQGLFPDGGYAWAYLGGPWISMSRYSSWAYNAANYYQAVPAHESGHIFYATDEYDESLVRSGYLNAADNDGAFCIMNQNSLGPFAPPAPCRWDGATRMAMASMTSWTPSPPRRSSRFLPTRPARRLSTIPAERRSCRTSIRIRSGATTTSRSRPSPESNIRSTPVPGCRPRRSTALSTVRMKTSASQRPLSPLGRIRSRRGPSTRLETRTRHRHQTRSP